MTRVIGSSSTYPKRLSDWPARENNRNFSMEKSSFMRPCRAGGSYVAHLNFKMSRVGVWKCFMALPEVELSLLEF